MTFWACVHDSSWVYSSPDGVSYIKAYSLVTVNADTLHVRVTVGWIESG